MQLTETIDIHSFLKSGSARSSIDLSLANFLFNGVNHKKTIKQICREPRGSRNIVRKLKVRSRWVDLPAMHLQRMTGVRPS